MFTAVPVQQGPLPVWVDRSVAIVVVAAAAACTALLLSVQPDPRGYDTHVQFGMSPCGWPRTYGIPCPTCGATTAACLLVHGHPLQAVATQPFGAAVAAAGLVAGLASAWCLLRRRSLLDLYVQLPRAGIAVAGIALLLGSWLYTYLTFVPPA